MNKITPSQMRKIHALSRQRGLDNDTLHTHIFALTNKLSIKELSIMEAVKVIDSLDGKAQSAPGMMTDRQRRFIEALLVGLGWTNENGKADLLRLKGFVRERFHVDDLKWIDSKTASNIIEALKQMDGRKRRKAI